MKMLFDYEHMFLVVFGGQFVSVILMLFIWIGLHPFVCRRFDKELFKAPWFRPNELFLYASWPFSPFRSAAYMLLLTFPAAIKKRRFKGVEIDTSGCGVLRFFSWLTLLFFLSVLFCYWLFLFGAAFCIWKIRRHGSGDCSFNQVATLVIAGLGAGVSYGAGVVPESSTRTCIHGSHALRGNP